MKRMIILLFVLAPMFLKGLYDVQAEFPVLQWEEYIPGPTDQHFGVHVWLRTNSRLALGEEVDALLVIEPYLMDYWMDSGPILIDHEFVGGDDSFSTSTGQAIENAVFDAGKILVIRFWSNSKFGPSLPATNSSHTDYGPSISVVDTDNPIFEELPLYYERTGQDYTRGHGILKAGSHTLVKYDNYDEPALIYWQYGNGYVIQWTLEMLGSFIDSADQDVVMYR